MLRFPDNWAQNPLAQLRQSPAVCQVNHFLRSPAYVILMGLLAAASNILGLEMAVYLFYIFIALYISILGQDFLPLVPLVIFCYLAPSVENNPGRNEGSIFFPQNGGWILYVLAGIFALTVIFRLVTDPEIGGKPFLKAKRKLLGGILLLGLSYFLSGAGSGQYFANGANNFLFAGLQFVSVGLMYWFFTGAVRWKEAPSAYFGWLSFSIGLCLTLELCNIYRISPVIADGSIDQMMIFTGWGIHNNIGVLLAMTIPGTLYLTRNARYGWIWGISALVFFAAVIFTCSRSSIACGALGFVLSCLFLVKASTHRRFGLVAGGIAIVTVSVFCLLFYDKIIELFQILLEKGLDPMGRDHIFRDGMAYFFKFPLFGGSFYPQERPPWEWSTVESFSDFFPPRWHSTIIQLAAACGGFGLIAYAFHRFQTLRLFFTHRAAETRFIGVTILVLLLTSLVDSHFFNVGPTLWYSILLAFAEKNESTSL